LSGSIKAGVDKVRLICLQNEGVGVLPIRNRQVKTVSATSKSKIIKYVTYVHTHVYR
jgi:hypothetical protein